MGYFCSVRILERSWGFADAMCPCNGKHPLGAEEWETRGKEAPGYLGGQGGIAIPVKLSFILAAAMPFSAVPSTGWRHSYRLGLSEMIYELGPNTCRNKKMQREPVQLQAKGRKDAMRLASPAAYLLLLCIKLFAAT